MKTINNLLSFSMLLLALLVTGCGGGGGDAPIQGGGGLGVSGGSGGSLLIPDSGQTSCFYDATFDGSYNPTEFVCLNPGSGWNPDGQDGYFSINPASFTDNGDGTVLDNVTELTWQKCSLGKSSFDCSGGSISSETWSDAKLQCESLNLDGTGWRLPTVYELARLVNYGTSYTAIDETVFPGTGPSSYWTSTIHANQASWAWYVNFAQGNTWAHEQTQTYYVRCVRG